MDAEFGNKNVVGHTVTHDDPLMVRMKSNTRVEYCGEQITLKSLLSHVPRACCHLYPKFNWRAKRIAVLYDGHAVDLLVIWRNVKGVWRVLASLCVELSCGKLSSSLPLEPISLLASSIFKDRPTNPGRLETRKVRRNSI